MLLMSVFLALSWLEITLEHVSLMEHGVVQLLCVRLFLVSIPPDVDTFIRCSFRELGRPLCRDDMDLLLYRLYPIDFMALL